MTTVGGIRLDTRRLDEIMRKLDTNAEGALKSIAFQVEGYAKVYSPIKSGALRNSLHTERISNDTYWVSDGVEYGIYQEFGTYKMAAHPFLVPAMEQVSRQVGAIFERTLFK